MARKKVDKTTISYMVNQLFHKEKIKGFQFTAGRTPRGIIENRQIDLDFSLNFKEKGPVIDFDESDVTLALLQKIFPEGKKYSSLSINRKGIENLKQIFQKLGYEYEEYPELGEWFWFRVQCKPEEIEHHINILSENLKDFNRNPE